MARQTNNGNDREEETSTTVDPERRGEGHELPW
jgi:hypothetical protein